MKPTIIKIQDQIAQEVVDSASGDWVRIVLNYEMTVGEDAMSGSIFFSVVRDGSGTLSINDDMRLPVEVDDLFEELNKAVFAQTGAYWGICDLVIEEAGTYDFTYDYGPAKRLNEVLDESSHGRFDNYLEHHRAELAAKA